MKIIDQGYRCYMHNRILGHWKLQCHLYIYFSHPEQQTIVISNLRLESGQFASFLMTHVVEQIIYDFKLNPDTTVWIEHYSGSQEQPIAHAFTHITFQWVDKHVQDLQRKLISHQQAQITSGESLEFLLTE
ncbi:MAG: hypothetical protein IGS54_28955 [Elainella sp. C42_A2020_010]|nr:hypothetical protein [Elainella sp. C42_A2020_010]